MRFREAVRALVLDPDDNVLLVRFWWEGLEPADGFWANPGGGLESNESRLAALQRELREETGLLISDLGPEVWTKTAVFPMTNWDGQIDHIHLVRTEWFDPAPGMTTTQLADEGLHDVRWWSPDELHSADVAFAPRGLPDLIKRLRSDGVPSAPIEITGF